MSIALDFPDRRAALRGGPMLDQVEHMDDTVEIALDRIAAGDRAADVIADAFRAGVAYGRRTQQQDTDPQAGLALGALDELACARARRTGGAS